MEWLISVYYMITLVFDIIFPIQIVMYVSYKLFWTVYTGPYHATLIM